MRTTHNILVVNFGAPEMNYLAAALSKSGDLGTYLRPYVNKRRAWERGVELIPGLSNIYLRTLGRRRLPPGLPPNSVREVAVLADFVAGCASRLGNMGIPLVDKITGVLQYHLQKKLGRAGGYHAHGASAVVASCLVALPAFRACAGLKVLNYPIAHHRYMKKFVAEESEREPIFASTLPDGSAVPAWVEPQLDAECGLADRILVGSSFARDSFIVEGIPADKLTVVPYGVDLSLFSPQSAGIPAGECFRVLFVGQIGQRKGISYLLKAYDRFRGDGTSLTLVGNFYGSQEPLRRYRKLFQYTPNVPRTRLADIFRRADVFVLPTLIEGLPLVVLEAMASGLPVIVTPNGPGDIVRDGVDGFVVPIRDVDAIVDRLEYLRANPQARAEMGRNARERALAFTWDSYQRHVVEAMDEMLEHTVVPYELMT
jgi:glycosyltransferase involved in cell wall biosynthesis